MVGIDEVVVQLFRIAGIQFPVDDHESPPDFQEQAAQLRFSDAVFPKTGLDGEDLRPMPAAIGKFPLTAISAKGAIAVGMDFSGTQLQGADFEGADLRGTSFEGADLRGAGFRGANLAHTKFMGADLTSLKLATGGTKPCQFAGATVTEEQLAEAILDPGFRLDQPAPA